MKAVNIAIYVHVRSTKISLPFPLNHKNDAISVLIRMYECFKASRLEKQDKHLHSCMWKSTKRPLDYSRHCFSTVHDKNVGGVKVGR